MGMDYIDRKALRDALYDADAITMTGIKILNQFPSADVALVRHGRWLLITAGYRNFGWCCSECGRSVSINCAEELRQSELEKEYPFCHCGARMDLEE